jgi:diguanylate cyclase (GGDEF)-like protein/PAS domain S-box-containing protein
MTDLIRGQIDFIYFVYGLGFILLLPICLYLHRRSESTLPWIWLLLFGAAHGLLEWLDLVALSLGTNPIFDVFRVGLLILSFLLLAEFGRAGLVRLRGHGPGRWVLAILLGLALLGAFAGLTGVRASARYALGLVGALGAAAALWLAAHRAAQGRRALQGAALCLAGYAAAAGLVVDPAPFFPASWLNTEVFLTATGVPIQLGRGFLAAGLSACLSLFAVASLGQEKHRRLQKWGRNLMVGTVVSVLTLVITGWFVTQYLGQDAAMEIRKEQEHLGQVLEVSLKDMMEDADQLVTTLAGSPGIASFLASPAAQNRDQIHAVLDRYSAALPGSIMYVMDREGLTIASSNRLAPDSFLGKSYAFRPYFRQAWGGAKGSYWALGVTSGELGYYSSFPVRDGRDGIIGVVVIKRTMNKLEGLFPQKDLGVIINADGVVTLTSRSNLKFKSLWPLSAGVREQLSASRQFGPGPFAPILTQAPVDGGDCRFQGQPYLVLRQPLPFQDWSIVILTSPRPIAVARLLGIIATIFSCLVVLSLLTIIGLTIESTSTLQQSENALQESMKELACFYAVSRDQQKDLSIDELCRRVVEHLVQAMKFPEITVPVIELNGKRFTSENYTEGLSHCLHAEISIKDEAPGYLRVYYAEARPFLIPKEQNLVNGVASALSTWFEHKLAEDALEDSEQKYRLLVTDVPAMVYRGYADWSADFFDDKIEELTGYTPEDFTSRRVKWSDLVLPEDLKGAEEIFKQALKGNKAFVREYRIKTLFGTVQWVRDRGKIFCSQDGRINYVTGVFSDITEQQNLAQELEELRRQQGMILNNAGEGIFGLNRQGEVTFANPAAAVMIGYEPGELVGRPMHELIHHTKVDGTPNLRENCSICASLQSSETRQVSDDFFWRADGQGFPVEYVATPVMDQGQTVGAVVIFKDITRRRRDEEALARANDHLRRLVAETEERHRTISLIKDMVDGLQSCHTVEEAYAAISLSAAKLFPEDSGALYLLNNTQNYFEAVAAWGESPPAEAVFAPDDCWSVRRNRLHLLTASHPELPCPHLTDDWSGGYLCVPMMVQGGAPGVLHVRLSPPRTPGRTAEELKTQAESRLQLAVSVSEHLGLSLANLKLRETLRHQAIRDPLTGLFNRRYLEETLDRELLRARRENAPVGVIMMDLDHFKQFNDSFGHGGGDTLLRELGQLIQRRIREEDVPCRWGGEEFLLIMPGASMDIVRARAEDIRQDVKQLMVVDRGKPLGPVTISLGAATFPEHGATGEEIIRAADTALYRAKHEGRDRVVAADGTAPDSSITHSVSRITGATSLPQAPEV